MRLVKNLLAGMLAPGPEISFARGAGGSRHYEGGGHGGIGHSGRGEYYHGGAWRHSYHGYGYYSPFEYGLGDYTYPYDDNDDSFDVQALPSDGESATLIQSVQKELTRLGYYHARLTGSTGRKLKTQSAGSNQSVTGQIDGHTLQALGIA